MLTFKKLIALKSFLMSSSLSCDFLLICSFERKFVQDLRQQQDEAYEESLRADQEKERLKQMEKDKILQQQQQEEAERLEKQRQKEVGDSIIPIIQLIECGTKQPKVFSH